MEFLDFYGKELSAYDLIQLEQRQAEEEDVMRNKTPSGVNCEENARGFQLCGCRSESF